MNNSFKQSFWLYRKIKELITNMGNNTSDSLTELSNNIDTKLNNTVSFIENLFKSANDVDFNSTDLRKGKTAFNGTALITGTMKEYDSTTVTASSISNDGKYTYLTVPSEGYYGKTSKIRTSNRDLSEKLLINLGIGRSFDIKTLCPNVDYTKLTIDNFIVGVSSVPASSADNYTPGAPSWMWTAVQLSAMTPITKTYNNTTGVLTLSGGSITARGYTHGDDSTVTNAYCTSNAELFAYLKL